MKYLITGGAGFVGSHLAEELLRRGHEVFVVDDLSTGSIENIRPLKSSDRFHYVVDTCNNVQLMAEMVDGCDRIFHLAAAVGVKLIVESPVRTIETNVHLTEVMMRLAQKKKRPILVASTSEVYGKSEQLPFREDGDLVLGATSKGRWSYACSKAIDEFLALAYWKEKGLPTVVVRLFNTVGPRQTGQYGMVIPTFVRQALAQQPLTVYGDGKQSRCFTHVADVVRALIGLMENEKCYGQVYNVGSTNEISIGDLAKQVREMCASRSEIVLIPYSKAYEEGFEDMPRRIPELSKINAAIGWKPTIPLADILQHVIDHFRRS
ncbi:MAG TPA: GDP-mannose 4,6-dehydratase [Polyangia bacterium]|nr:GDP-mannose 4,6-dehydratase [Polyangia bacterium]